MDRGRRRIERGERKSLATQYLSLSLFIMLLAFFIVLNAISQYEEEKVNTVVESLEGAFSSKITQKEDFQPSVTASPEHSVGEGNTPERLEALFKSRIPHNKIIKNDLTGTLHVFVKWEEFKKAVMKLGQQTANAGGNKAQETSSTAFFLPSLVALLRADQMSVPYHMDILLNVGDKPAWLQNQEPQKLARIMKEIGVVAVQLEHTGLPAKLMSAGLKKGKEGLAELYFRPHIPFNPLGIEIETDSAESETEVME